MKKQLLISLGAVLLVVGCSTTEEKKQGGPSGVPEWVSNPTYKDGIAATECVPQSNNFSLDRKEAVANARQALAQQIDLKVQSMEETYQRRTRGDEKESSGTTFESVSRQVTESKLNGSRAVKTDYVNMGGTQSLCAKVAFGDSEMEEIFNGIVEASDRDLDAQSEDVLYQEFKEKQARERLDEQLKE
ncbi:LPP20 family lipoprotein [Halorhodospira neutriphila]|uniref:LPP20 lipoprotein n=1 Tax=Halorhodospira neutriphila TaxID=168379 RepID=A0ABS1E782_9GAMM|nr:LPP20 family lipoprotein [Halorhodospira neutriphila]MBK1726251.1 hypothetical protein [Halorhodospira neutriphila]